MSKKNVYVNVPVPKSLFVSLKPIADRFKIPFEEFLLRCVVEYIGIVSSDYRRLTSVTERGDE